MRSLSNQRYPSPLYSSSTVKLTPNFGHRVAPSAAPDEPLSENELRGLSASRFLQRFFRSPAVLALATGQATAPNGRMVRRLASVKFVWLRPSAELSSPGA